MVFFSLIVEIINLTIFCELFEIDGFKDVLFFFSRKFRQHFIHWANDISAYLFLFFSFVNSTSLSLSRNLLNGKIVNKCCFFLIICCWPWRHHSHVQFECRFPIRFIFCCTKENQKQFTLDWLAHGHCLNSSLFLFFSLPFFSHIFFSLSNKKLFLFWKS